MAIRFLYPEGNYKALTMSYDDGVKQDRRLVELFNQYGIKATFHLNSGCLDSDNRVTSAEVETLYRGHEVSCHSVTHPYLERIPRMEMMREIWEDRKRLEELVKYPVVGMSYPMGSYDSEVIEEMKNAGIVYSRTTVSTNLFSLPKNFLEWHPSCHHSGAAALVERFLNVEPWRRLDLFYIWGHAYEFDNNNNWELIENLCRKLAHQPGVWYATNIQLYYYISAIRSLTVSADGKRYYNTSAQTVWLQNTEDQSTVKLAAGETYCF